MAARKHLVSLSFSLGALVLMNGCAPATRTQTPATTSLGELAQDLRGLAACEDSRDQLFEAYYRAYADGGPAGEKLPALPRAAELEGGGQALQTEVDAIHELLEGRMRSLALEKTIAQASEIREGEAPESESDPVLHLIRLEMRSKIDPVYDEINRQLDRHVASARSLAREQGLGCSPRITVESQASQKLDARAGDAVYGARRTMATAYQSCQVIDLSPVDNSVENVQGVVRGKKEGAGWGREYSDVALLKRTHYYHRVTRFGGACVSQNARPLVYDYGGKPKVVNESTLDLFANSGGGSALGIDCSAFVSAAVAMAGMRYQEGKANRAIYSRHTSSDFVDPAKSNWNCYERITVNDRSTIRPGDIAAYPGHIVMVDSAGADPFGLRGVSNLSQCDRLSVRNFDFVLIQSSSSQEHLGINRYHASEYLAGGGNMTDLFVKHARAACLSKFDHRGRVPSSSAGAVIRHRGTTACLAPRVELKHEDCTASCANL